MALQCPFCGAPETDRIELEGSRILIFRCLFSPEVPRDLGDPELVEHLRAQFSQGGSAYFRGMCDRLHLYVTRGEGSRELGAEPSAPD